MTYLFVLPTTASSVFGAIQFNFSFSRVPPLHHPVSTAILFNFLFIFCSLFIIYISLYILDSRATRCLNAAANIACNFITTSFFITSKALRRSCCSTKNVISARVINLSRRIKLKIWRSSACAFNSETRRGRTKSKITAALFFQFFQFFLASRSVFLFTRVFLLNIYIYNKCTCYFRYLLHFPRPPLPSRTNFISPLKAVCFCFIPFFFFFFMF